MSKQFTTLAQSKNYADAMGVVRGLHKIRKEVFKRYPYVLDDLHRFGRNIEKNSDIDFSIFQFDKPVVKENSTTANNRNTETNDKSNTANVNINQNNEASQNLGAKVNTPNDNISDTKSDNKTHIKTNLQEDTGQQHKIRIADNTKYKFDYQNYMKKNEDKFANVEERAVPSGQFGRAFEWAKTGTTVLGSAGWNTAMGAIGFGNKVESESGKSQFLLNVVSEGNAERLSQSLCKMRGAALKVGQMLAIQEESLVPKPIKDAFEKAKQSANIMPQKQLYQALDNELGYGWRDKFER